MKLNITKSFVSQIIYILIKYLVLVLSFTYMAFNILYNFIALLRACKYKSNSVTQPKAMD